MKTITGLFDSLDDAQRAANELMERGVPRDRISVVAREEGSTKIREHEVGGEDAAAEGAGAGAVGGTVVGGAVGLLVGAGLLAIPGIGPVLAIGPLAAAIGTAAAAAGAGALGAGVGAGVGGLMGGLIGAGVPEERANDYIEGVRRGGTLLAATVDPAVAGQVDDLLRRHGAVDIDRRAADWRSGADTTSTGVGVYDQSDTGNTYSSSPTGMRDRPNHDTSDPANPTVLRDHRDESADEAWKDSSKVGTAAGVLSGAATGAAVGAVGGPVGAVIGGVAGAAVGGAGGAAGDVVGERAVPADEYRGVGDRRDRGVDDDDSWATTSATGMTGTVTPAGNFEQYESDFQTHAQSTGMSGRPYDYYEPAYRFGYQSGSSPRYTDNSWDAVEMNLRQDWERNHPSSVWEDFKAAVRYSWEKARGLR